MTTTRHDPSASWRNYQRVRFIKGFYQICHLVKEMFDKYERTGDISHEHIHNLLENRLRELRRLSDILYQMPDDEQTDRKKQRGFDKVLGELWHELDKIRDNLRIVEAYCEEMDPADDKMFKALNRLDKQIVTTARRDLPLQLRRARRIVDILIPLFEQILPVYQNNSILLRTIYFDRAELNKLCKPSPVEYFYPLIFRSAAEGYLELIRSLLETKHKYHAEIAIQEFEKWVEINPKYKTFFEQARTLFDH